VKKVRWADGERRDGSLGYKRHGCNAIQPPV
jgi:hypothetical protein